MMCHYWCKNSNEFIVWLLRSTTGRKMAAAEGNEEYKMVVLGSGAVGKSALTIRLVTQNFLEEYDPTIEDNYNKTINVDSIPAHLDILDTAGQDEYSQMQDQWMREGKGWIFIIYWRHVKSYFCYRQEYWWCMRLVSNHDRKKNFAYIVYK